MKRWRYYLPKMLQLATSTLVQAQEKLSETETKYTEYLRNNPEDTEQLTLLFEQVKINEANVRVHQETKDYCPFIKHSDGLLYSTTPFLILNAMLNSLYSTTYQPFSQFQQIIANEIISSTNLHELSEQYDDLFLVPMRAKGGRPRSRPCSATERFQNQDEPASSSSKSNAFKSKVRERYVFY
jgi:hypothetical protein